MPPRRRPDAAPTLPGPGEPPLPAWPGSTVDAGGLRLHVRRAGDPEAPPAVFVHGLGGAATNWTDLMALLAPHLDEHAVDLPGFGWSDPPRDGRYGLDTHAAAVVAYLEHLDRGPVHLFGNSMGGAASMRVAAERPDLVRTLTLISPALPQYRLRRTSDPRLALLLLPGLSNLVSRERARAGAYRAALDVLTLCTADVSVIPPERVDELADELRRRRKLAWSNAALSGSLRGLVRSYFEPGPRNLWRQLGCVEAPTLVVWGERDRLVPSALAAVAVRRLRNGRLLTLPDAGHIAQVERPHAVAEAVLRLLADADGLRATA